MVPLTLETPEFKMQYIAFGSGEKPLVILPGLSVKSVMESADMVEQSYSIFSKEYRVYLFDRRLNLPEDYPVWDMAEDTAQAMKALDLNSVCLYGVSQGGMMAQIIALRHPELVEKLAVCSTSYGISKEQAEVFKKYESILTGSDERFENKAAEQECSEDTVSLTQSESSPLRQKSGDLQRKNQSEENTLEEKIGLVFIEFAKLIYTQAFYEQFEAIIEAKAKTLTKEEAERFIIFLRNITEFSIYDELSEIKCPVLALAGKEDTLITPDCAQAIAEKTGGELEIYEGFGHAVYDEQPEIKQRLYDFFHRKNINPFSA